MLESLHVGENAPLTSLDEIDVIGHRIVHGGSEFTAPVKLSEVVIAKLRDLTPLAPAHQPAALEAIDFARSAMPKSVHCAVFDTAFHHAMPLEAQVYSGPYEWYEQGIRRYGFHGISYQYITARICLLSSKAAATARIVACHLGNGASVAAIHQAQSQDTTMGFTPLDGLMMGTRSGAIDPGILLYLLHKGELVERLEQSLQKESGLLGISGVSADMRSVLDAAEKQDARAILAIDMFVHRLAASIAAMTASIGGLDILAFTGGIGEHAPVIRERVCRRLAYLGLQIDAEKNKNSITSDRDIALADSAVEIYVIKAEEDWAIACEARSFAAT